MNVDFPTDRGHFPETLTSSSLKKQIILYGPCKPSDKYVLCSNPMVTDGKSNPRRFSSDYYYALTKMGSKIPRIWLCYSVVLEKTYCETCWLFADRRGIMFKTNWINGINDWQHLTQKIIKHEVSKQHVEAIKLRSLWSKNNTIDKKLEQQICAEAQFWRDVLRRHIKIILFLTAGNTALRGNEGKVNNNSEGNFLRTVKLLAQFDPVLSKLLYTEESKVKYLSWKIQNEVIELLASETMKILSEEIRSAHCFTIIMDSTQDITKLDQVSFIFRYVVVNYDKHTIDVKESFLGFYKLTKHGAEDHVNLIYDVLNKFNLDIKKCRGQGYDGAAVMSGVFSGVQKRISDIVPNASYVHCTAHNLNLVISDVAKSSLKMSNFFDVVQTIFLFFSKSAPRWASLAFGDEVASNIRNKVLKKVCNTRWEARHTAVYALKVNYIQVLKSLTNIILTSNKNDEKNTAVSLKKKMESFEFVISMTVWEKVLKPLSVVSKILQSPQTSLHQAVEYLQECIDAIQKMRNTYEELVFSATELCSKWGISIIKENKRKKFAKRQYDSIDNDKRLYTIEENFRISVFLPLTDTAIFQLQDRFKGLETVSRNFDFLQPLNLIKYSEENIIKSCYDFISFYSTDVSSDLTRQVLSLRDFLGKTEMKTIKELSLYIIENDISSLFSEIFTACIIFLSLPVSVASAERSFSKLKLIKNYLRNSISQERLTNISILNIERARTDELNIDHIIDTFANQKARKKNFLK